MNFCPKCDELETSNKGIKCQEHWRIIKDYRDGKL